VVEVIKIDDQPIAATFFNEVSRLTEFITPNALEVKDLYHHLTDGINTSRDRILACWHWVAADVKYVKAVRAKIWVEGRSSAQSDLWQLPSMAIMTRVGNCANKAFLLASLLRNELPPNDVYCVLGNLHNGVAGGHAWVQLDLDGEQYTMESTMPTAPPLIPIHQAVRYEAVHFFNDMEVHAVEGRTQLVPFAECYSTWLESYLNWAYINRQRMER